MNWDRIRSATEPPVPQRCPEDADQLFFEFLVRHQQVKKWNHVRAFQHLRPSPFSDIDNYPAFLQRSVGCLQKLHHAPASLAAIKRLGMAQDTVDKVLGLVSERLGLSDLWRTHVARTIA